MDPTRPPLPRLAPPGCDPIRLQDDEATDEALRRDLAANVDAFVIGIDYAAIRAEWVALLAGAPHDACG